MEPIPPWEQERPVGPTSDWTETGEDGVHAVEVESREREVPFRADVVAEEFLERAAHSVNFTDEEEERIRAAVIPTQGPPEALIAVYEQAVNEINRRHGGSNGTLSGIAQEEFRAAFLAQDDIRAAWLRQGDVEEHD